MLIFVKWRSILRSIVIYFIGMFCVSISRTFVLDLFVLDLGTAIVVFHGLICLLLVCGFQASFLLIFFFLILLFINWFFLNRFFLILRCFFVDFYGFHDFGLNLAEWIHRRYSLNIIDTNWSEHIGYISNTLDIFFWSRRMNKSKKLKKSKESLADIIWRVPDEVALVVLEFLVPKNIVAACIGVPSDIITYE